MLALISIFVLTIRTFVYAHVYLDLALHSKIMFPYTAHNECFFTFIFIMMCLSLPLHQKRLGTFFGHILDSGSKKIRLLLCLTFGLVEASCRVAKEFVSGLCWLEFFLYSQRNILTFIVIFLSMCGCTI